MFLVNELVSTKKKTTFLVPSEFADAFEELAKGYGEKKKWWVHTAAVLLLLEQAPDVVAEYVGRVAGAEPGKDGGSYQRLVDAARAKGKAKPKPEYKKKIGQASQSAATPEEGKPTPEKSTRR
jgi:hypothetical protein